MSLDMYVDYKKPVYHDTCILANESSHLLMPVVVFAVAS